MAAESEYETNQGDGFASRVNYFDGQLLDERDFKAEQEYHREAALRHNRDVHGKGIARGLDVQWYQGRDYITVAPGSALDGRGCPIVLRDVVTLPLPTAANNESIEFHLALAFQETQAQKREYEGEDALRYVSGFTRVDEKAALSWITPGTAGDAVVLGGIRLREGVMNAFNFDSRETIEMTAGDLKVLEINFIGADERETGARIKGTDAGELRFESPRASLNGRLILKGGISTGARESFGRGETVQDLHGLDACFGAVAPVTISAKGALGFNAYRLGDDWKVFAPGAPLAGIELKDPADLVVRTGSAGIADTMGSPAPGGERLRINNQGLTVSGDLEVSGRIREAGRPISGSVWTPLNPRGELGPVPFHDSESGSAREYPLPSEVPATASEVLVYAYIAVRNNERDQSVEVAVHSGEDGLLYTQYLYARCYDPHAGKLEKLAGVPTTWISASGNFWLPITNKRTVGVSVSWLPGDGDKAGGEGSLYLTGYR